MWLMITNAKNAFVQMLVLNGTEHFKNCKQLIECQDLLLLRDIWWSKL
jgi:hypothetical protein